MGEISQFRFPTDIRFGAGSRSVLAEFSETHKVNQPLLVTDNALTKTEAYNLVNETMKQVWGQKFSTFSGVHPNPTDKDVDKALQAYQKGNCDGIVGLGGGSALDVARALRLKAIFPERNLLDMPFDNLPKLAVMCAIPTTAGTGSEVGRSSVITITELGGKKVFGAGPLMTQMAILDPELTVGLPANLTAWTGMDAMTHAVEAYVCPIFHPMCDAIALEAIRMVRTYLRRAYENGKDIEARGMMQVAAAMGAVAFQKDLGAAHSMAHPLSTECNIQHGIANAVVLPAVVRFNGENNQNLYDRVASALDINPQGNSADRVAEFIEDFNKSLGIAEKLSDLNVAEDKLDRLAEKAFADPCHPSNPRACTKEDFAKLYKQVF
jgi:4-hydroxybutyrate dehydrogenase